MDREAARLEYERQSRASENQHGRGPRRRFGPFRWAERYSAQLRVRFEGGRAGVTTSSRRRPGPTQASARRRVVLYRDRAACRRLHTSGSLPWMAACAAMTVAGRPGRLCRRFGGGGCRAVRCIGIGKVSPLHLASSRRRPGPRQASARRRACCIETAPRAAGSAFRHVAVDGRLRGHDDKKMGRLALVNLNNDASVTRERSPQKQKGPPDGGPFV